MPKNPNILTSGSRERLVKEIEQHIRSYEADISRHEAECAGLSVTSPLYDGLKQQILACQEAIKQYKSQLAQLG